ncbi:MAG: tetratricopeptide repeat protein [Mucilaginibacter sp.]|nr:tetratricopeptide repeat protein [Mucilaginibacter sp.]
MKVLVCFDTKMTGYFIMLSCLCYTFPRYLIFNKVKLLRLTCILFAACFLAACSVPQYVNVPVDYAPKQSFNRAKTTIVVINHYMPDSTRNRGKRILTTFKAAAYTAINNAAIQLHALPGVKVVQLVDSVNFTTNTDSVKFLAKKYKASYVLAFEDFKGETKLKQDYYNGMPSVYRVSVVNTSFTLYEANGIYFRKLNGEAEINDTNPYGNASSLLAHGGPLFDAIRNSALDALKDYLPYTDYHDRPLYANGDQLSSSVELIKAGKFDKAFQLLNPLIDGPDLKLASRAAYNLAVVYEAQGDIEAALDVAKISNQKQPNDFAKAIIVDLMKE